MKILAIVVTYYPKKELLEKNVNAFIEDVEKVLIWENTPSSDKIQYRYLTGNKIEYCSDGTNSISRALNYGWQYAKGGDCPRTPNTPEVHVLTRSPLSS